MTTTLYHAPEGERSLLLQRDGTRVRAIRWDRFADVFSAGPWQPDGADADLLAAEGAQGFAQAPQDAHSAPGDERVLGLAGHRLYATLTHCACHREWALLKDLDPRTFAPTPAEAAR